MPLQVELVHFGRTLQLDQRLHIDDFVVVDVDVGEEGAVALPHLLDAPEKVVALIESRLPMKKVASLGKLNLQRHSADCILLFRSYRSTKFGNETSDRVLSKEGVKCSVLRNALTDADAKGVEALEGGNDPLQLMVGIALTLN